LGWRQSVVGAKVYRDKRIADFLAIFEADAWSKVFRKTLIELLENRYGLKWIDNTGV
jgi:hypothetical protein